LSHITRRQLAEMMGLSEATLRSYVSYGEIPPPNVPMRVIEGGWSPEVILTWLEERTDNQRHRRGPKFRQPTAATVARLRRLARG